jgi:hypothetical protein
MFGSGAVTPGAKTQLARMKGYLMQWVVSEAFGLVCTRNQFLGHVTYSSASE